METLRIDILNPKAIDLLKNLASLNLIKIREDDNHLFFELIEKLRKKSDEAPSFEEITKEVELVRSSRYGK